MKGTRLETKKYVTISSPYEGAILRMEVVNGSLKGNWEEFIKLFNGSIGYSVSDKPFFNAQFGDDSFLAHDGDLILFDDKRVVVVPAEYISSMDWVLDPREDQEG